MMLVLAMLSLLAIYYMSGSLRPSIRWSVCGAAVLLSFFLLSMFYLKDGTNSDTVWTQVNVMYFSSVTLIGTLHYSWFYYDNLAPKLKMAFIATAALLFSAALFIIHTAIPIFLYSPPVP